MINWSFSSVTDAAQALSTDEIQQVQDAIIDAGAVWARYLDSKFEVTFEIDLTIDNLSSGTLAEAGTYFVETGKSTEEFNVGQAITLNELNTGVDLTPVGGSFLPTGGDIIFNLNAAAFDSLYFETDTVDRDTEVGADNFDFFTIALHELGHALGLLSFRNNNDQINSNLGSTFDALITFDDTGDPIFTGSAATEVLNGQTLSLTPTTSSHIGDPFGNSLDRALDSFSLQSSTIAHEQRGYVTALDVAILEDIGATIRTVSDEADILYGFERAELSEYFTTQEITVLPDEVLELAAGNDVLSGARGDDRLYGLSGDDTLIGGLGDDVLDGGQGNDIFIYNRGDGDDIIQRETISSGIDELVLSNIDREDVSGRQEDNIIVIEIAPLNGGDGGTITLTGSNNADVTFVIENLIFDDGTVTNILDIIRENEPNANTDVANASGDNNDGVLLGGALSDTLLGEVGNDIITGLGGDDLLDGAQGSDLIDGGEGFDTVTYQNSDQFVIINLSGDRNFGGDAEGDTLIDIENIIGSAFGDLISGNQEQNVLIGGDGRDNLIGFGGNDRIDGGAGVDIIQGVDGNNTLIGGADGDIIFGGIDGDLIEGGTGHDLLFGDGGDDLIFGGDDNDTLNGGIGKDIINGDDGDDFLIGDSGADVIAGGNGNDVAFGGIGDDEISGGAGSDSLVGEAGNDVISGNDGADFISGGAGSDTLDGGAKSDLLVGGDGNDTIYGGNDSDVLIGGAGSDILNGGSGVDILFGNDNSFASSSIQAGSNILNGGDGGDLLFGGKRSDQLNGDAGDDVLYGGGGNDQINGGSGNDFLVGEDGMDVFIFEIGNGADTIIDFEDNIDLLDISNHEFANVTEALSHAEEIYGNVYFDFGNNDHATILATTKADLVDDILV